MHNIVCMTITTIRNQAINILLKNEVFILSSDGKSLKFPKSLLSIKDKVIEKSFDLLEQTGYVTKIVTSDDIHWILEEDLTLKEQMIPITPYTANGIANLINQYREAMEIKTGECDKMKITELDIQSIIIICGSLLNSVEIQDDSSGGSQGNDSEEDDEGPLDGA